MLGGAVFSGNHFRKVRELLSKCKGCGKKINESDTPVKCPGVQGYYHQDCFKCSKCGVVFDEDTTPGGNTQTLLKFSFIMTVFSTPWASGVWPLS